MYTDYKFKVGSKFEAPGGREVEIMGVPTWFSLMGWVYPTKETGYRSDGTEFLVRSEHFLSGLSGLRKVKTFEPGWYIRIARYDKDGKSTPHETTHMYWMESQQTAEGFAGWPEHWERVNVTDQDGKPVIGGRRRS